jgi:hypothetical protein
MRIDNLSLDKATYKSKIPKHIAYQINRWMPNDYYGKEKDYIKVNDEFYQNLDTPKCRIHKSCFTSPEVSFTIATFRWYENKGYILEFEADEPMRLNYSERQVFWELLEEGFKILSENGFQEG